MNVLSCRETYLSTGTTLPLLTVQIHP